MTTMRSVLLLLTFAACAGRGAQTPPRSPAAVTAATLISRQIIFGNPERAAARLSPDGAHVSWLAPRDGVLNIWVAPTADIAEARPITDDRDRGIRNYFWAYDNRHVLYVQDEAGDENWRLYSVDIESAVKKDLTPIAGVRAEIQATSERFPMEVLVGLNDRDPRFHDLYRVDIANGTRRLVQKNDRFARFVTDDDFSVRFALRMTPDGGTEMLKPGATADGWQPYLKIAMEDDVGTAPLGFDESGQILYMTDSRGRNTSALVAIDLAKNGTRVLAQDKRADVAELIVHPTQKTIQAVSFHYTRKRWEVLDAGVAGDLEALGAVADGDFSVTSRTLDDTRWIVSYVMDDGPLRYYLYDRPAKKATFLFTNRRELEGAPLAKMHPVVIEARDGLPLVSYLTLPRGSDPDGDGRPTSALPLVLYVHGGPWSRDAWGFNSTHQWLANRGYAVLSVNYRGSVGFGKDFVNAANLEWAGTMHDDLLDAVAWATDNGIAPKDRICIMGGSYGGYATLVGLTFTPEVFACGVDIVGPSNLETLLASIPPYWAPMLEMFAHRVGDPRTPEGKKLLNERSPLTRVDAIKRPLLIGQGANDPRVKQAESDQIVRAMQEKGIPVTYVLFADEGHGFARPENRLAFYAVAEQFLARHLGGSAEPIGTDFAGAKLEVPAGANELPALLEALRATEKENASQLREPSPAG